MGRSAKLEIEERDLGGGWVEAFYLELSTFRAIMIQDGLPAERVRLYELAAHSLEHIPQTTQHSLAGPLSTQREKGGFFIPRNFQEANALLVRAVSEVIEEMEPEWISAVEKARRSEDDADTIAFWSGVPIEALLAVVGDWRTRP